MMKKYFPSILFILFISALLVIIFSKKTEVPQNPQQLFLTPVKDNRTIPHLTKPFSTQSLPEKAVVRSRETTLDLALLTQSTKELQTASKEPTITLNLFDDTEYTILLKNVEHATATPTVTWSGHIVGMPHSHVSIANTNGVFAGSIRTEDGKSFKIVYRGKGLHAIEEIDESHFPQENTPRIPQLSIASASSLVPMGLQRNLNSASQPPKAQSTSAGLTFDVMVLYTPAARVAAGGTAAIQSIINSSIATMNTTFANSNITPRVQLVHTQEISYTRGETGLSSGFETALDDLTNTNDGHIDTIHTLRDQYKADMVQLLFNNNSSGGLAWVMTDPDFGSFEGYAFSVVHYAYADGWALDHEFGHNMGMVHDRANSNFEGSYSYSYGYQSPTNAWHTVMAYPCSGWCPRIDNWSNPTVTYSSEATGKEIGNSLEADAKTTLHNNAHIIASWRSSGSETFIDLVLENLTLAPEVVNLQENFDVNVSVRNRGTTESNATTLRYYLSTDETISPSDDTLLATEPLAKLSSNGQTSITKTLLAPNSGGTYHVGVCVDAVTNELNTGNNCYSAAEMYVVTPLTSNNTTLSDTYQPGTDYYYKVSAASETNVTINLYNLTTNIDLYANVGTPPLSSPDCSSLNLGTNTEKCSLLVNSASDVYFMVRVPHNASTGTYSLQVTVESSIDSDKDGIPDVRDDDDDNDSILDIYEDAGIVGCPVCFCGGVDTDGDYIADHLDLDSDGDGIPDKNETNADPDNDNIPNFRDLDSDNDSLLDKDEGTLDSDNDTTPDYLDTDVPPPNYTPTLSATGTTITGASGNISLVLQIGEYASSMNAVGDLIVIIPKNKNLTLSFDPSETNRDSETIHNNQWELSELGAFYKFKYIGNGTKFPKQNVSNIGISGVFTAPKNKVGQFTIQASILQGSGETDVVNNKVSVKLGYDNLE
jgi:hypothetical protein